MSTELLDHIASFIKEVGGPTALSFGLLAILWQQTSILKRIQESLDRLHDALLPPKGQPLNDPPTPSLHPVGPARCHPGRV